MCTPQDIDSLVLPHICIVCGNSYVSGRLYTCNEACHKRLVERLVHEFGEFKKVVDIYGKAYRVPTRDIMEKGLRHSDLAKYPEWKEGEKTDE